MTITREQVADLQPGDTVEYHGHDWPEGHTVIGPLYERAGSLWLASDLIRFRDGGVTDGNYEGGVLAVISRARRRLYTNHPRSEPVVGDVARSVEFDHPHLMWAYADSRWYSITLPAATSHDFEPGPLRLLVDGETGEVVR